MSAKFTKPRISQTVLLPIHTFPPILTIWLQVQRSDCCLLEYLVFRAGQSDVVIGGSLEGFNLMLLLHSPEK